MFHASDENNQASAQHANETDEHNTGCGRVLDLGELGHQSGIGHVLCQPRVHRGSDVHVVHCFSSMRRILPRKGRGSLSESGEGVGGE